MAKTKKVSIFDFYFEAQDKYSKIYGPKTIVFVQMGKFYDAYCTKTKGYVKLGELESLLGIHYIRRDDEFDNNQSNKPNQFGIHCVSIRRNLTMMVESGYTIVIFDQVTADGENIERECVGVYSPGTFISDRQLDDSNYIVSVYISEEPQLFGNRTLLAIGITIVDITTGTSTVHEFSSSKLDEKFGLDELVRILQTFQPTELVVYFHPVEINANVISNIKQYAELDRFKCSQFYVYNKGVGNDQLNLLTESSFKIGFQNDYIHSVFNSDNAMAHSKKSPIEILGIEQKPYAIISLMVVLVYVSEHNVQLLKNLSYPEIYSYNKHLILGNNAIEQLNILSPNNLELSNHKIGSVFDVINKTSTPMGKRFLKESLLNPLSQENRSTILNRYEMIESLLAGNFYSKIKDELKIIYDIERLHRRMAMGTMTPNDFYRLDIFYQASTKIISMVSNCKSSLASILDANTIKEFVGFQIEYNREFDFTKMRSYKSFNDVDKSFFKKGVNAGIDKIQEKIDTVWSMIGSIKSYFTSLIPGGQKSLGTKSTLEMECNDRDGYYFTITKGNERILKNALGKSQNPIRIQLDSSDKEFVIKREDIVFKPLPKGRTKIFIGSLAAHTVNLGEQVLKLSKLIKEVFVKSMVKKFCAHKMMMHKICKFIAEIDFAVSGAIVAKKYYYCKPAIPSETNVASYLRATKLRHAIVERLCVKTEFVPNDIELGSSGVLLYGLNSCGKSTLMKSIGIAIILAQIGYYVPAEEFVYEPYMALYARITGNDNIFKGLSSFELEMTELDAILLRTSIQPTSTIVIGDEICRGTEATSGLALVASAIVTLSECNSTFIFSSHLHDLPNVDEVKQLTNLKLYHLRVDYDKQNDCLVFDRKLTPGSGPSVYGLAVAKYLIKNTQFISRAEKIKNRITGTELASTKSSNYNRNLLIKSCRICEYRPRKDYHKELETHHIHFQKDCTNDGKILVKPYLSKNELYNLVVLCRKCHMKTHREEIIIAGYKDSSIGPVLDYRINPEKSFANRMDKLLKLEAEWKQKPKKITTNYARASA